MIVDQSWLKKSRLGGLRRVKLHGNPGTPEGRKRGGQNSIKFFHGNPELARASGFVMRKMIRSP